MKYYKRDMCTNISLNNMANQPQNEQMQIITFYRNADYLEKKLHKMIERLREKRSLWHCLISKVPEDAAKDDRNPGETYVFPKEGKDILLSFYYVSKYNETNRYPMRTIVYHSVIDHIKKDPMLCNFYTQYMQFEQMATNVVRSNILSCAEISANSLWHQLINPGKIDDTLNFEINFEDDVGKPAEPPDAYLKQPPDSKYLDKYRAEAAMIPPNRIIKIGCDNYQIPGTSIILTRDMIRNRMNALQQLYTTPPQKLKYKMAGFYDKVQESMFADAQTEFMKFEIDNIYKDIIYTSMYTEEQTIDVLRASPSMYNGFITDSNNTERAIIIKQTEDNNYIVLLLKYYNTQANDIKYVLKIIHTRSNVAYIIDEDAKTTNYVVDENAAYKESNAAHETHRFLSNFCTDGELFENDTPSVNIYPHTVQSSPDTLVILIYNSTQMLRCIFTRKIVVVKPQDTEVPKKSTTSNVRTFFTSTLHTQNLNDSRDETLLIEHLVCRNSVFNYLHTIDSYIVYNFYYVVLFSFENQHDNQKIPVKIKLINQINVVTNHFRTRVVSIQISPDEKFAVLFPSGSEDNSVEGADIVIMAIFDKGRIFCNIGTYKLAGNLINWSFFALSNGNTRFLMPSTSTILHKKKEIFDNVLHHPPAIIELNSIINKMTTLSLESGMSYKILFCQWYIHIRKNIENITTYRQTWKNYATLFRNIVSNIHTDLVAYNEQIFGKIISKIDNLIHFINTPAATDAYKEKKIIPEKLDLFMQHAEQFYHDCAHCRWIDYKDIPSFYTLPFAYFCNGSHNATERNLINKIFKEEYEYKSIAIKKHIYNNNSVSSDGCTVVIYDIFSNYTVRIYNILEKPEIVPLVEIGYVQTQSDDTSSEAKVKHIAPEYAYYRVFSAYRPCCKYKFDDTGNIKLQIWKIHLFGVNNFLIITFPNDNNNSRILRLSDKYKAVPIKIPHAHREGDKPELQRNVVFHRVLGKPSANKFIACTYRKMGNAVEMKYTVVYTAINEINNLAIAIIDNSKFHSKNKAVQILFSTLHSNCVHEDSIYAIKKKTAEKYRAIVNSYLNSEAYLKLSRRLQANLNKALNEIEQDMIQLETMEYYTSFALNIIDAVQTCIEYHRNVQNHQMFVKMCSTLFMLLRHLYLDGMRNALPMELFKHIIETTSYNT